MSLQRGACSLEYRVGWNALDLARLKLVEPPFRFDQPCPLRFGVGARFETRDEPRGEPGSIFGGQLEELRLEIS